MCMVPKLRTCVISLVIAAAVLAAVLAGCGGGSDYTVEGDKVCSPIPVPVTDMRRECHAIGTDECAYITTEQYTYTAVGYKCN